MYNIVKVGKADELYPFGETSYSLFRAIFRVIVHCVCVYVDIYILYPFICGWTFSFHVFAVVNSAAVNSGVLVSFQSTILL